MSTSAERRNVLGLARHLEVFAQYLRTHPCRIVDGGLVLHSPVEEAGGTVVAVTGDVRVKFDHVPAARLRGSPDVLTPNERERLFERYFSHDHPNGRDIAALIGDVESAVAAKYAAPVATERQCGSSEYGWSGHTDRMCGGVGPLCPDCGEVTEAGS